MANHINVFRRDGLHIQEYTVEHRFFDALLEHNLLKNLLKD